MLFKSDGTRAEREYLDLSQSNQVASAELEVTHQHVHYKDDSYTRPLQSVRAVDK